MKSLILTIPALLFSILVSAQSEKFTIEKGAWSVGGFLAINSTHSESESFENKNFGFSLRPQAGYFLKDNLAIGMQLGYNYNHGKYRRSDNFEESKNNAVTIAPYLQKFFGISEKFAIHLIGSLEYSRLWYERDDENCLNCIENTRNVYGVIARPGISYLISDKFTLDANLGALRYSYTDATDDNNVITTTNSFGFDFGLSSIYFGLTFYLN